MSEFTIDPARYAAIALKKGSHSTSEEGMCLMEATAFLVGERHSDNPKCVSPVLGTFGRNLNDVLPDELRQKLKGLIPSLPGTANDGWDERRSYLALDWLIRTCLPAWLELSPGCGEDARNIRALGRITDLASAVRAGRLVREAQKNAAAAGSAASPAGWNAARAVARDAGWNAARDAARDAAWDATGAVAGDVARAVHGAVAGIAGGDVVASTVRELQLSAIDLYVEMITPEPARGDGRARTDCCGHHMTCRQEQRARTRTRRSRTSAGRRRKRVSQMTRGTRRLGRAQESWTFVLRAETGARLEN